MDTDYKKDIEMRFKQFKDSVVTYRKDILIGVLAGSLVLLAKKNHSLSKQNNVLQKKMNQLVLENRLQESRNEELWNSFISLAGDATRCGSSLGGKALSEARTCLPS